MDELNSVVGSADCKSATSERGLEGAIPSSSTMKIKKGDFMETQFGMCMKIYLCKMYKYEKLLPVEVIETQTMIYVYELEPKEYGLIEPLYSTHRPY